MSDGCRTKAQQIVTAIGSAYSDIRSGHDSHLHPPNLATWIVLARHHWQCHLSCTRVAATSWMWDSVVERWVFAPNFGSNEETMLLVIAIVLMLLVQCNA